MSPSGEPRDVPFNPWRRPASALADGLVDKAVHRLELKEQRRRARRAKDRANMKAAVAAIICDAVHRELTAPNGWLMVPFSKQVLGKAHRYRSTVLSESFPKFLRLLSPEYVEIRPGEPIPHGGGRQTTYRVSTPFRDFIRREGVNVSDFREETNSEPIILKGPKSRRGSGKRLDYDDTSQTREMRANMNRINDWLETLRIESEGESTLIDTRQRRLQRIFNNGRFDHGGRLFGGFWMNMSKADRGMDLTLEGDLVATVDFRQMMPRLLYARAGVEPPEDCYLVPGYESYRDGWKRLLNSLIYRGRNLKRFPQGIRPLMPRGLNVREAEELLLRFNRPIASLIRRDLGFELTFVESEILVDILLELSRRGIAALPLHDAVIVPDDHTEEVSQVMLTAFQNRTGHPGAVSVEPWYKAKAKLLDEAMRKYDYSL